MKRFNVKNLGNFKMQTDSEALKSDWDVVGNTLRNVMGLKYSNKQHSSSLKLPKKINKKEVTLN